MEETSDKSSSTVSSFGASDSETETWEVVQDKDEKTDDEIPHKQENPKITIDKVAESTHTLDEQIPSNDDEIKKEEIVCQESDGNEHALKVGKSVLLNR